MRNFRKKFIRCDMHFWNTRNNAHLFIILYIKIVQCNTIYIVNILGQANSKLK
jgi:hypothetical protein